MFSAKKLLAEERVLKKIKMKFDEINSHVVDQAYESIEFARNLQRELEDYIGLAKKFNGSSRHLGINTKSAEYNLLKLDLHIDDMYFYPGFN